MEAIATATRGGRAFLWLRSVPSGRAARFELLRAVRFGTVLLDLHVVPHVPSDLLGELLDHQHGARVVASAPDQQALTRAVGPFKPVFWTADVPALAKRSSDIPWLLAQRIWELGQRDLAEQLLHIDLRNFSEGEWEGNLDELHTTAPIFIALLSTGTATAAAKQLGWSRGRMRHWLTKYGLSTFGRG